MIQSLRNRVDFLASVFDTSVGTIVTLMIVEATMWISIGYFVMPIIITHFK